MSVGIAALIMGSVFFTIFVGIAITGFALIGARKS